MTGIGMARAWQIFQAGKTKMSREGHCDILKEKSLTQNVG